MIILVMFVVVSASIVHLGLIDCRHQMDDWVTVSSGLHLLTPCVIGLQRGLDMKDKCPLPSVLMSGDLASNRLIAGLS